MKILLSDLSELGAIDLPDGVETAVIDEKKPVPPEHRDAEGIVLWGINRDLTAFLGDLPNLRWIQALMAGPDKIMALDLPDDIIVTAGRNLHDGTVAEHALTLALTMIRSIPTALEAQTEHRWASEIGGIQPLHPSGTINTLLGAKVTVWGFGAIGQEIARVFSAMGAKVTGIARKAGERSGFPVVDESHRDELLTQTDVLIMVLPHSPETTLVLDEHVLSLLPSHAHVVNVGRGSAVDEAALVNALEMKEIAAAALDVVSTEPLPAGSPLWDAPNLVITPHMAGGRPIGAEKRIAHNVRALLGLGGEMIGVVKR